MNVGMMSLSEIKTKMKTDMSSMSAEQKYLYLKDMYIKLWDYPDLAVTYTVGVWINENFNEEIKEIAKYNEERI